jgi:tetratricopeptide (TPR) repeat protein
LASAADRLETDPEEAEKRALEVMAAIPAQQHALMLLVSARKARGDWAGARAVLESMAAERPGVATLHFELGTLLGEIGDGPAAVRALSRVVELEPKHPGAWRLLGEALVDAGDVDAAAKAFIKYVESSAVDLKLVETAAALGPQQVEIAEEMLRQFLNLHPTDVAATYALGKLHLRLNLIEDAEKLFARTFELAPDFAEGANDYLSALQRLSKWEEELQAIDLLLNKYPDHPGYRFTKARVLSQIGEHPGSLNLYEELLREFPAEPAYWSSYAYELRTVGRREDCIAAYHMSVQLEPGHGQGWWGLAALKTYRFPAAEIELMRAQLLREDLATEARFCLHFALGEALEHERRFEESFGHYCRANSLRRAELPHDAARFSEFVQHLKKRYTREFFDRHRGMGCPSTAPIFILGMPRAGSTLVEQILSCHSAIEGAGELPCLAIVANASIAAANADDSQAGAEAPLSIEASELRSDGERYLERSKVYRKLGRPLFTDKAPVNFLHLGLICAMLPHARIIDVRRHPMACCFSNFKQLFPTGLPQTYDLTDIGCYYRDYVDLMAHIDETLPGRVHRVFYEDLVGDPENQVRALLAYCGVPFEESCLRFHQTDRTVLTLSSEQVKQPIYADANDQWRHYEQWLEPLRVALGPVLETYPGVPGGFGR